MKACVVQEPFGLDTLTLVERPEPQPGPGRVLVRVRADEARETLRYLEAGTHFGKVCIRL